MNKGFAAGRIEAERDRQTISRDALPRDPSLPRSHATSLPVVLPSFFIRASKPTRRKLRSSLLSDRCPIRRLAQFLLAYHLSHVLFFSRYITFSSSLRRDARPSSRESSFHARILRIIRIHGVYCVLRVCPYMSFLVTLREFTCVHAY